MRGAACALGVALAMLPTGARASDSVFFCAPGTIENTTPDIYFKTLTCTEVDSVSFGTQSQATPGGAPGAPAVEVAPIVVTLHVDQNTPNLGALSMSGDVIPTLTLNHRRNGMQSGVYEPYLVVTVQGARVIEAAITQAGDDVPKLRLVLDWTGLTWSLRPITPEGTLGTAETFTWPPP